MIKNLISAFNRAPLGFCNSDNGEILTHQDIRLRQLSESIGVPSISNMEMVFRKFYELREYTSEYQVKKIPSVMIFLYRHGLNTEDIGRILDELVSEINNFNKFPKRQVFYPFS